jgi:predicted house-cleaning NTP pyrophosphatase (Maf/HAM1 superfamily)
MEKFMKNTKLTSVKILENLYERFKLNTVNTKMTLQKLTNRSVDRYLEDEKYREEIETYDNLTVSGSNF